MKVTYTNVEPAVEAVKQVGRVVLLGIIPIMISGINLTTGDIAINWKIVLASAIAIILTAALSGIDKARHLEGKIEDNDSMKKGLTGF